MGFKHSRISRCDSKREHLVASHRALSMGCQSRKGNGWILRTFLPFAGPLEVEPRGVEPLTSAVQSQIHNVVVVRRCSKTPANKHILTSALSCLFAVVRVGWCTTGVSETRESPFYTALQTMLSHSTGDRMALGIYGVFSLRGKRLCLGR